MWGESNETTELAVGLAFLVVCALVLCWANRRSGLPVISDEEHDRAVLLELGLEPVALLNTGATSRVLSTRVIPGPEQSRKRSMSIQNSDGASGRVDDHELVCVKLIMREPVAGGLTAADVKTSFESELGILQTLAHADAGQTQAGTTLQLVGSFESDWCYIILSRLAQGGDLFQLMAAQLAHFSELSVARVAENMAQAVHRCHSLNIAHRDIKPENFVFQDTVTDPTFAEPTLLPGGGKSVGLQLIDFGESVVRIDAEEVVPDFPGTLNYAAPEVITRGFDMTVERWKAADMWSLGVVVYILVGAV
jgi:serine/threonine protein kinase